MANEYTDFWLKLLEFGDTEEKRRKNWNIYCNEQYRGFCRQFVVLEAFKSIQKSMDLNRSYRNEMESFNELANTYGGHPQMPEGAAASSQSLMDFSGRTFEDDISFRGRLLIKADFRETVFKQNADFRDTVFLGLTHFQGTKFRGAKAKPTDGVSFTGSTFEESRFVHEVDFSNAIFDIGVGFENAEFQSAAKFDKTKFREHITFNNARFQGTTSFRNAVFDKPPKFFETELHEDVDFGQVNWKEAEQSYGYSWWRGKPPERAKKAADKAVRAWDRLALIMSQREKPAERHEFFRLRMRAQRQRDGRCLLSLVNWLFDVSSDHGWGVCCATNKVRIQRQSG